MTVVLVPSTWWVLYDSLVAWHNTGTAPAFAVTVLLALAQGVALIWRRVHPARTATVVGAGAVVHFVIGTFFDDPFLVRAFSLLPIDVTVLVALFSVAAYGSVIAGRLALGAAMVGALAQGIAAALPYLGYDATQSVLTSLLAWYGGGCAAIAIAAWGIGLIRRARLTDRHARAQRDSLLRREREQQLTLAAQSERTRIAREMHDIVAHSLSVVIAQADGGRYAAATDPATALRALDTISETGRAALADMRRILGVLRTEGGDTAALTPQPNTTDIATLVEGIRATMPVSLIEMGTPQPLPPGIGATVHRIAQEALTNVLKHAGPDAATTVMLKWSPERIVLQVDDNGRGAATVSDGSGHGVLGMRERATMLGGEAHAGPRPGGGYRVHATIPLQGITAATSPIPAPPSPPSPSPASSISTPAGAHRD